MPFSGRQLDDWITSFIEYTENTEAPYTYRKWSAISTVASALQRKCRLDWGVGLTWYPNLYIVLVGPASARKGTAMGPAKEIIEEVPRIKLAAQATSRQALIRRLKQANYNDPDIETGEMQFHSSMTVFSEEFTVFLGFRNLELISDLCNWYDCERRWTYDTIARDMEEIVGVWVNILGATTPDLIKSSLPMDAIGSGLTSRIIYVFEEGKGKTVTLPMKTKAEQELFVKLAHDLEKIGLMSGSFKYTNDFLDLWDHWYNAAELNPPFKGSPMFSGYVGRRPVHLMKITMVMAASQNKGKFQMVLDKPDLERAIEAQAEVEEKMGMTFGGIGRSKVADLIYESVRFLVGSETDEIPVWQFASHFHMDMDKGSMDLVLHSLESMGAIRVIHRPQADNTIKLDRAKIKQIVNS